VDVASEAVICLQSRPLRAAFPLTEDIVSGTSIDTMHSCPSNKVYTGPSVYHPRNMFELWCFFGVTC